MIKGIEKRKKLSINNGREKAKRKEDFGKGLIEKGQWALMRKD